ncbi:MAG: hypothetical protein KC435_14605 [Thermomicrobiales bacterium]|nr:hypothetical protein [Thermomicrobiales bacterium]
MRIPSCRFATVIAVLAMICTTIPGANTVVAQQSAPSSMQVIAHGVDNFDGSTMMWQVSQRNAGTDRDVAPTETETGFVYASGDPLTIADSTAARGDYLRFSAAAFHPRGALQLVVGDSDTTYTEIALSSNDLGGDYTSNGIQTPTGDHAVELERNSLPNGATDTYAPTSESAYLLHVTSGTISILDDEDATYDRSEGESITITGEIRITATSDATYVIASIGPEVTVPPFVTDETGTLTVEQFDCPAGTDPTSDASSCTAVEEPWIVNIHPSGRDDDSADLNIPDDGVNDGGTWTWTDMSVGTWYISPATAESDNFEIVVSGATADGDHFNAEITANEETVVSIYLVGERPTGNGWLDIARLSCDAELPDHIALDTPGCVANLDGAPSFTLIRVNDDEIDFDESNVSLTDDGLYRVSDVPAGVYVIAFAVPEDSDVRIGGDVVPAGGVLRYIVLVSPEGQTVVIYAESDVVAPDPGATPQG